MAVAALSLVPRSRPGPRPLPALLGRRPVASAAYADRVPGRAGGAVLRLRPMGRHQGAGDRRGVDARRCFLVPNDPESRAAETRLAPRNRFRRDRGDTQRRRNRLAGSSRRRSSRSNVSLGQTARRDPRAGRAGRVLGNPRDPGARGRDQMALALGRIHERRRVRQPGPSIELVPGLRHLAARRLPYTAERLDRHPCARGDRRSGAGRRRGGRLAEQSRLEERRKGRGQT